MKRILILLMAAVISLPQVCIADDAEKLMGLGIPGPAAEYIAEDMANLQVTDITTSDDVIVGDDITFTDAAATDSRNIVMGTTDADDDASLCITGGGACASVSRGSFVRLFGNETANTGDLLLWTGSASGAVLDLNAYPGNGTIVLSTNNSADLTIADNVITIADGTALKVGNAIGWTNVDAANQACSTTCGISDCIIGTDGTNFVTCADATADSCLCDGAAS